MMRLTKGNLLESSAEALVNTVNTVGVMGKGVALMFKEAFPDNYKYYRQACESGEVQVGKMFVYETGSMVGPKWIINFPTKKHWRSKTKLEWVGSGLDDLRDVIERNSIRSIAIPALGCGNGGLSWISVKPIIIDKLDGLLDVQIDVYEPTQKQA